MCGIVGVQGHQAAVQVARELLRRAQNRGQEGAGFGWGYEGNLASLCKLGMVTEFSKHDLSVPSSSAIGHVRYGTSGKRGALENLQPIEICIPPGIRVQLAHNGNLTNAEELRAELEQKGHEFRTDLDTEVMLHLLTQTNPAKPMHERLRDALLRVEGAYTLVVLTPQELIAVMDPHGFHPLWRGTFEGAPVFASEDASLRYVGATREEELQPGTMLVCRSGGAMERYTLPKGTERRCIFEYVYFARPDSRVFGRSTYAVRQASGRELAKQFRPKVDVVVPIPSSGNVGSIAYSHSTGIPYEEGLTRAHGSRSFIEPDQGLRVDAVAYKLGPVEEVLAGRSVLLGDDSIVRATTSKKIVAMVRAAGAREVHLGIFSPPVTDPCRWGIDTPEKGKLAMSLYGSEEGIRRYIGADSIGYLSEVGMYRAVALASTRRRFHPDEHVDHTGNGAAKGFCDHCFTGRCPTKAA